MTTKDLELIDKAKKVRLNHEYIASLIMEADTQEAKDVLADMERDCFIRHEQTYCDVL